jgi:hypothetical protein
MLSFESFLCILDVNPLLDMWIASIFSWSVVSGEVLILLFFDAGVELGPCAC